VKPLPTKDTLETKGDNVWISPKKISVEKFEPLSRPKRTAAYSLKSVAHLPANNSL
jgi:hypothetical protein